MSTILNHLLFTITILNIIFSNPTSMIKKNNIKSQESIELSNYIYPKNSGTENSITVAILGTNDIHGAAYEQLEIYKNQAYTVGGYKLLSSVIDNFRKEYKDNFLWLDAGDQFSGTYENTLTNGNLMKDFYNVMGLDLATLGNHEWDNGEEWLREKMSEQNFFSAVGNLFPKKGVEDLSKRLSYKIIELPTSSIKIGIIGLTTLETMTTTSSPPKNFEIIEYLPVVKRYTKELKSKGADAVLILSHVGIRCSGINEEELYELKLRDKNYPGKCNSGELMDLLPHLDLNDIDGVIAGHIHSNVHHFINSIPIIQTVMSNIFTNIIYLQFDKITKKIVNRSIEGPIPLCSHVYTYNKRCDVRPLFNVVDRSVRLVNFTLHSMKLIPNTKVVNLFKVKFNDIITRMKNHVVASTEILLKGNNSEDNFLGNLVTDIIREEMKTDVAILNNGSLRAVWEIGNINLYDVYKMFPFLTNHLAVIKVDGANLKRIVEILQKGNKGSYSYSG